MWSGFTDRELGILGKTLDTFHTQYPVDHGQERRRRRRRQDHQVDPGRQRARRRAVVHGGRHRDLLRQWGLDQPGAVHRSATRSTCRRSRRPRRPTPSSTASAARCRPSPTPTASTTTPTLLKAAGYTEPPEDGDRAAQMAVKLTTYNSDGSIKVAGFDPLWGVMEMAPAHVAPTWGATWATARGKSNFAADPHWAAMLQWQKKFVDAIGYQKLRAVQLRRRRLGVRRHQPVRDRQAGDEHRRRVPHRVHRERAPEPAVRHRAVARSTTPSRTCTARATSPATRSASRRRRPDAKREAAWDLVKWLSLDPAAEVPLAQQLKNVPTVNSALSDPSLTSDTQRSRRS